MTESVPSSCCLSRQARNLENSFSRLLFKKYKKIWLFASKTGRKEGWLKTFAHYRMLLSALLHGERPRLNPGLCTSPLSYVEEIGPPHYSEEHTASPAHYAKGIVPIEPCWPKGQFCIFAQNLCHKVHLQPRAGQGTNLPQGINSIQHDVHLSRKVTAPR